MWETIYLYILYIRFDVIQYFKLYDIEYKIYLYKNDIFTWPRSTAWREQANGCEEVNVKRKKNNDKIFQITIVKVDVKK